MAIFKPCMGSFMSGKGDNFLDTADVFDEASDCKFPMWVVPIKKAIEVTGRDSDLPCHEDLQEEGALVEYDPRTMARCIFFSHTSVLPRLDPRTSGLCSPLLRRARP